MEERIAWELGYNVCVKFLGDDMILLSGLSNEKVQEIINMETTTGNTLFYAPEKWRPGCRTKNRTVWMQLWGFPIEVWDMQHFKTVVSTVGDVVEPDDDTEDRRRLDRARLLIRTPSRRRFRRRSTCALMASRIRCGWWRRLGAMWIRTPDEPCRPTHGRRR